ncbi:MAG: hypothetical protein AAGA96_01675 [Verrucomicrobiota bacterium]
MNLSPVQSLLLLVLMALAVSGWLFGLHWKKIASGAGFSQEEKLLIQLQDQIRVLTEENLTLRSRLDHPQLNELLKGNPLSDAPDNGPPADTFPPSKPEGQQAEP